MGRPANLICSFCGRKEKEVQKLVQGTGACICDLCIRVCQKIVDKAMNEKARLLLVNDVK